MHRRSRPIPLAAWIASRNPVLRARAETALYHFGPDAGDALFAAADSISRFVTIKRKAFALPPILMINAIAIWLVESITKSNLALILGGSSIFMIARLAYIVAGDLYWRRRRLKVLGLALVKRDDLRGIGPLLEAWRPVSFSGKLLRDEEIDLELTRILPLFLAQKSIDLRSYKKRILRRKVERMFPYRISSRQVVPRGNFSETRSDLIVTLIQLISRSTSEKDHALIDRISRMAPHGTHYIFERNAVFIRDAAGAYRNIGPEAAQPNAYPVALPAAHPTSPTQQIAAVAKRS